MDQKKLVSYANRCIWCWYGGKGSGCWKHVVRWALGYREMVQVCIALFWVLTQALLKLTHQPHVLLSFFVFFWGFGLGHYGMWLWLDSPATHLGLLKSSQCCHISWSPLPSPMSYGYFLSVPSKTPNVNRWCRNGKLNSIKVNPPVSPDTWTLREWCCFEERGWEYAFLERKGRWHGA